MIYSTSGDWIPVETYAMVDLNAAPFEIKTKGGLSTNSLVAINSYALDGSDAGTLMILPYSQPKFLLHKCFDGLKSFPGNVKVPTHKANIWGIARTLDLRLKIYLNGKEVLNFHFSDIREQLS